MSDVIESHQNNGVGCCSDGSVPFMSMKDIPLWLVGVACLPKTLGQPSGHESWSSWGIWWAPHAVWRVGEGSPGEQQGTHG